MKLRISDICRCYNLIVEPFFNDDGKKEYTVVYSVSGDILAFFPRGNMSFDFWNALVYGQCSNLQNLLTFDIKDFQNDISRLTCASDLQKRRLKGSEFMEFISSDEKKNKKRK